MRFFCKPASSTNLNFVSWAFSRNDYNKNSVEIIITKEVVKIQLSYLELFWPSLFERWITLSFGY